MAGVKDFKTTGQLAIIVYLELTTNKIEKKREQNKEKKSEN